MQVCASFWFMCHTFQHRRPLIYRSQIFGAFAPSVSFCFVRCLCVSSWFLLPSCFLTVSLPAPSVPPSQWLCGFFLHLSYVTALRGRGHFNQYFKQPSPLKTRSKCHVTTWQDDIWRRRGGTALKYLLLPTVLRHMGGGKGWGGGIKRATLMIEIRDHWREEKISGKLRRAGR